MPTKINCDGFRKTTQNVDDPRSFGVGLFEMIALKYPQNSVVTNLGKIPQKLMFLEALELVFSKEQLPKYPQKSTVTVLGKIPQNIFVPRSFGVGLFEMATPKYPQKSIVTFLGKMSKK